MEQKQKVQQISNGLVRLRTLPNVILPNACRNFMWINELSEDLGAPFPFKFGHHVTVNEDINIFSMNMWVPDFKTDEAYLQTLPNKLVQGKIPGGKRIGPLLD
eukprot:3970956-Karenia_brevis.AAC.1